MIRLRVLIPVLLFSVIPAMLFANGLQFGVWPQFGMQRNNKVIFANDYTGLGITGRLGWRFERSSAVGISLNLDLNFLNFGTEHWYVPLAAGQAGQNCDVYSDYRIVSLCPGLSFGLHKQSVRPYCEIYGGPARFTILNNFNNERWDGQPLDQEKDLSRTSFVFGLGGGMKFVIWKAADKEDKSWMDEVMIDVKADYQRSGNHEFVTKQNLQRPGGAGPVLFQTTESQPNLLLFRFGIMMNLD